MALNHLGTADPPPLARVALRAYLDFHQTALDEWRDSDLDREALLALLERTLTATVAAAREAPLAAHHSCPTNTGSGTSSTPNASCTPPAISRARATSSAVVPAPRLVSASVCLAEIAMPVRVAVAAVEARALDEPGGRGLDLPVGVAARPAARASGPGARPRALRARRRRRRRGSGW